MAVQKRTGTNRIRNSNIMKSPPTSKTAINKTLKKMTLKNKAKLLDFTIGYYGLHLEGELWKQIHKLEGKK